MLERQEIAEVLSNFLKLVECRDMDILLTALETYAQENLDFVDCILFGYHKILGAHIATFDKKLLHLISSHE